MDIGRDSLIQSFASRVVVRLCREALSSGSAPIKGFVAEGLPRNTEETMQRTSSTKRSISTPGTACGSIKPHRLPPDGFNPRAASVLELRRYGLPQRPDPAIRPKLAARWDEIFSRKLTYI